MLPVFYKHNETGSASRNEDLFGAGGLRNAMMSELKKKPLRNINTEHGPSVKIWCVRYYVSVHLKVFQGPLF